MQPIEAEAFETLWQHKVFALLLRRGRIDDGVVRQMRGWRHSGFSVHHAVRLAEDDTAGLKRLAQYMLRCPFNLQRVIRVTDDGKVLYRAEKRACRCFPRPAGRDLFNGVSRNFQVFDPSTSSPSSPSASHRPTGTWSATSASTPTMAAACGTSTPWNARAAAGP